MFSLNLTELHVLIEEHKEAYEQIIKGYFDDVLYVMIFLKYAKYYYQSSEFLLCYYYG